MAIQEITSPPLLDETGQGIATALDSIASAVNSNAGQIDYSNATSHLSATKVQGAIDEVKGITDTISSNLAQFNFFGLGTSITTGSNLNNYNTIGLYNFSGNTYTNAPSDLASSSGNTMLVMPRGGIDTRVFQVLLSYASTACAIYIRAMSGSDSWTSWTKL